MLVANKREGERKIKMRYIVIMRHPIGLSSNIDEDTIMGADYLIDVFKLIIKNRKKYYEIIVRPR